jgi:hypothetical protein
MLKKLVVDDPAIHLDIANEVVGCVSGGNILRRYTIALVQHRRTMSS